MIIREARSEDVPQLVELLRFLGHPIAADSVVENLARLADRSETPLVAAEGAEVLGLIGLHIMVTVHRDGAVGRIPSLSSGKMPMVAGLAAFSSRPLKSGSVTRAAR